MPEHSATGSERDPSPTDSARDETRRDSDDSSPETTGSPAASSPDASSPDTSSAEDSPPTSGKSARLRRAASDYAHRISFAGLIFGTIFLWLSTTPSLLPRGPLFQGIVSGGAAAVGYCVGAFIAWLVRFMLSRSERWPSPKRNYWLALGFVSLIGTVVMLYWYSRWQTEIRNLMGVENLSWTAYPIIVVFALLVFAVLMVIGRHGRVCSNGWYANSTRSLRHVSRRSQACSLSPCSRFSSSTASSQSTR